MFIRRWAGQGGPIEIVQEEEEVVLGLDRMARGQDLQYEFFYVNESAADLTLERVALRTGTRVAPPAKETVEIEAGGGVVGSADLFVARS